MPINIKKAKVVKLKNGKRKGIFAIEVKCDTCGEYIKGGTFPVFDENHNKQEGLLQCENCYASALL